MDIANPPERFWHCAVKPSGAKSHSVVNDLTYAELEKTIVAPWLSGRPFTVAGTVVRSSDPIASIKITHTDHPKSVYADQHNARMRSQGVADMATNRSMLPLQNGHDATYDLLFSGSAGSTPAPDGALIEQLCKRLPQAARILAVRSRKGKAPYEISDEYDVQDLLHSVLRAYLKYSVQEDPLPKVAGAKSSRADISIEELGVLLIRH